MLHLKKNIVLALGAAAVFTMAPTAGTSVIPAQSAMSATCEAAAAPVKVWDFSKDAGQWAFVGGWNYSGDASTAWDASNGGCLKVNVDFSGDKDQNWSEIKLSDGAVTNAAPIKVGPEGVSQVSFDLYYDASQLKGDAALKGKVYAGSVKGDVVIDQPIDDMGTAKAKKVGNLMKTHVRVILEDKVTQDIGHLEVSLVGYLTGYKGAVYLDNITLK